MQKYLFLVISLLSQASVFGEEIYYYASSGKLYLITPVDWQKDEITKKQLCSESSPSINPAIGLMVGINYDVLNFPVDNKRWTGIGYNIGFEFEFNLWKIIGCALGSSFLQDRYSYRISAAWGDESTYVFNNLTLPIEINLSLGKHLPIQPSLKVGVTGVFQLSGRITGWVEPSPINSEITNLSNKLYFRCGIGLSKVFIPRLKMSPRLYYHYNLIGNADYIDRPHQFYDFLFNVGFLYMLDNSRFQKERRHK